MTETLAGIGHNGAPPDVIPDDARIDARNILIASRGLHVICAAIGNIDPQYVTLKKAGGEYMHVRNLWLFAMSSHIPRGQLSAICRLNPKTVTTYRKQMEEWADRNGLLRGFYDMILDMVEPIPGIVDDARDALEDMRIEAALDRVRKSVDGLTR